MEILPTVGIIVAVGVLLLVVAWWLRGGRDVHLRPLPAFGTLEEKVGEATESASKFHLSLGQASLINNFSPTSIAAFNILDRVARDGCANGTPPLVTVGEGTLLLVAQERLLEAYRQADQVPESTLETSAEFVAHHTDPYAYAGGVAALVGQNRVASNVLVGHFGPELAIMTDAADRKNIEQIIGADDPVALALGFVVTGNVLIGEELFAAGAYLEGKVSQLASLQTQDILRLIVALAILGFSVYRLANGG